MHCYFPNRPLVVQASRVAQVDQGRLGKRAGRVRLAA